MIAAGAWRKSSYSTNDSNCVEVAAITTAVGVRDTKDREAGHLTIPAAAWAAFLKAASRTS